MTATRQAVCLTRARAGVDDAGLEAKQRAVAAALEVNAALIASGKALDALQAVGGLEIAAMAGACLEAARQGVPIVVDGFISGAGGRCQHGACLAGAVIGLHALGAAACRARAGAAALAAVRHEPTVARVLFLSHQSAEKGAQIVCRALQACAGPDALPPPALDLGMRLGEGTGAVLMLPLLRTAAAVMSRMATLQEAL